MTEYTAELRTDSVIPVSNDSHRVEVLTQLSSDQCYEGPRVSGECL